MVYGYGICSDIVADVIIGAPKIYSNVCKNKNGRSVDCFRIRREMTLLVKTILTFCKLYPEYYWVISHDWTKLVSPDVSRDVKSCHVMANKRDSLMLKDVT